MKKLKQLLAAVLAASAMFYVTACGAKETPSADSNPPQAMETQAASSDVDSESEETIQYNELIEMYVSINDIEIKLNSTTVDEYLEKSGWKDYEVSSQPTEVNSSITLKDGVNEIKLVYLNENGVIFQLNTNEDFDNSVTNITYRDSYIDSISIGDTISNDTLSASYRIDNNDYRFYLVGDEEETLIILYDKNNEPVVLNYFYYGEQNSLSGLSLWWYIY